MATFDPSVIQDIGNNAASFDPAADVGKALTLADLYDQRTLTKSKLRADQQSQEDMTYAKQILAGKDLSKLDDQNAAVAKITQRNPQMGMELMRGFQGQQKQQIDINREQLELYNAKNDMIGASMLQLKQKHDQIFQELQAKFPNAPPQQIEQQIHDQMKGDVMTTVKSLASAKLPNGQPLLDKTDAETIQRGFGNGYDRSFVDSAVSRSQQARDAIKQRLAERKEDNTERATTAAIANNNRRGDQADRRLTDQEKGAAAKIKLAEGAKFSEEDADWLAGQYLAGDKSVMVGLGRGAQGPQNIIMVRHAIAQQAKDQGMKPADVAARLAEYTGFVSEQRSLGTQQANVEMASSEAQQMIANARQASDDTAIARAHTLGWNKLSQWTDKQLQDDENPKLASLAAATTAVINTWARAINPKGVATVADKEHGYELLNKAQDKATFDAVLDRFQQETEASLAAPASAKARLHDAFLSGLAPTAAPVAGPGTLQPTPGRGAPPAGGPAPLPGAAQPPAAPGGAVVMKFDAQGNPIQ